MHALRLVESPDREAERIALAADGDEPARTWLVQRWTPVMYRYALRMLDDPEDAADAAQDILIKVLRALPSYDPERSFSTWIFGIARNTCIDAHRRRKHRVHDELDDVPDATMGALGSAMQAQRAAHVHAALARLPEAYREVLVLFHFEHLKYVEIAEILGEPIGTTMNRIFRARQRMRALLENGGGLP